MFLRQKKPQSSVRTAASGLFRKTAESAWSLYSITVAPFIGCKVLQSCTIPVIIMESMVLPVENTSVYPGNMLPSLLSAMAFVRSSVYVLFESRSLSKYTTTPFPFSLNFGDFSRGGDRKRLLGSFTVTYSLNLISICGLCTGTPVSPGYGFTAVMTGGIVSFGPPLGGVVVLAQECENITCTNMAATGMAGRSLYVFFFILLSSFN